MVSRLFLFDCDGTLWDSEDKDYISSVHSDFKKVNTKQILRVKDGKFFTLKPSVLETFIHLSRERKNLLGIVSDNNKSEVIKALKLFNLFGFIFKKAINIKLWKGYCPKDQMVSEVIQKVFDNTIVPKKVFWFDDKDYHKEARRMKVTFIKVGEDTNLTNIIESLS